MSSDDATKRPARVFALSLALTAAFVLLYAFRRHVPSQGFLFVAFFLYIVMLPGYLAAIRLAPWARGTLRVLASFVCGSAIAYAVLFAVAVLRSDIRVLGIAAPIAVVLLALPFPQRRGASPEPERGAHGAAPAESRAAVIALVALAVVVSLIVVAGGDPFSYTSDSAAHIAYVKAVSRTHEAFPEQFYYRNGGMLTHDIRQGMGQALWGAIDSLTGSDDTVAAWPWMSLSSSIFLLVALYAAGVVLLGSAWLGFVSSLLFVLFYAGGLRGYHLASSGTGFALGQAFYVAALAFLPISIASGERRFILFAAVAAALAATSHIAHLGAVLLVGAVFTLSLVAGGRGGERVSRLRNGVLVLGASLLACLPYLALRYVRDYAPGNPLHRELQGALFITKRLYVLNPMLYAEVAGPLGILSGISIFALWARSRAERNLRLLLNGLIAVYLLMFVPLWYPFLFKKLTYLMLKFEFAVPSMIVCAALLGEIGGRLRRRLPSLGSFAAVAGLVCAAALLGPPLIETGSGFAYGARALARVEPASYRNLDDLWPAIDSLCAPASTVASDPITSFGIPAFTDEFVMCPSDQHATPNDTSAIARIVDARRIFSPVSSIADIRGALDKYGARYLVVNGRIPPWVETLYWKPSAESAAALVDRLRGPQSPFRIEYEREGLVLAKLVVCPACREANPVRPHPAFLGDTLAASEVGSFAPSGTPGVLIARVAPGRADAAPGDTVAIEITWIATRRCPFSSYIAYLRFDTPFPKGPLYSPAYGKPYRKAVELFTGRRYRFRTDFQPLGGLFPPDAWPPMREVRERAVVTIPRAIARGTYAISLKLTEKPQYPNYMLTDILTDRDFYSGAAVGSIVIR
jgi:hypothetical protein